MLDLTFGPSFKVKQWFTGFGELSFWWIQICIGSLMRRSSCALFEKNHTCLSGDLHSLSDVIMLVSKLKFAFTFTSFLNL